MADGLARAVLHDGGLAISVALTTRSCRRARNAHALADTATIALGRLITATALTGFVQDRPGAMSLQIVASGRITQIFADVTESGFVRGYVKPPDFTLPRYPDDQPRGRRSIAGATGQGVLSVIRTADDQPFRQSTTKLVSGEVDDDVQHFLESSDQIPAVLVCDVLLADDGTVETAGGVLAQGLPGADAGRLAAIRGQVSRGGFAARLGKTTREPIVLLKTLFPDAEVTDEVIPLRWRCRCSLERVLGALQTFDAVELAAMVDAKEPIEVTCDFCNKKYTVGPTRLRKVFELTVEGRA